MCAFDVQITTVNDHSTSLSVVTSTSVCSCKECAHETRLHISTTAVAISRREFLQKIFLLKKILSSLASYFSYPFLGTATRRTILVPAASPTLGAVGNWSPPSPSASSPELPIDVRPPGLGLQLVRPFCKSFSSALMLRITLWSNSSNSSLVLRLRPPCLLKNFHACSCFSWRGCTSSARACANAPDIAAGRLASCSRTPGAFGLRLCLWP